MTSDYLNNKRNFLLNVDWYDINFITGFLYKNIEIKEQLNNKKYQVSKDNLSPRLLNHYINEGLLIDDRTDGKGWHKFSMSEIIWIHIIIKLRNFGLDLKRIKRVHEYLSLFNSIEGNKSKYPILDFYITHTLAYSMPISLIVFDTGESMLARQIDIDTGKQFGTIVDDFISIDLNKLVHNGFKNKKLITDYINYAYTPLEKEIKNAVYFDDVKKLSVEMKNGEVYLLKKSFLIDSKREMESMMNKLQYAESKMTKRGNKIIHHVEEQKKINKY